MRIISSSATNSMVFEIIWVAAFILSRQSSSCLAANIRGGNNNKIVAALEETKKDEIGGTSGGGGGGGDSDKLPTSDRRRNYGFQSRIVGGKLADAKKYGFSVNLGGCGGSLIHEDIVLSAAHCQPLYPNTVRVGGSTEKNGLVVEVDGDGTPHPLYSSVTQDYDFMVYKLASPAYGYTPVPLNKESSAPSDTDALTVIGFGSLYEGGPGSFDLQQVTVGLYPHDECDSNYHGQVNDDIMFCAGVVGGGKDSCQGDSGGPIIDQNGVQVGVTSFGNGCAQNGFPGVYARVSAVSDWIQEQVCTLSNNPPSDCPPNTSTTTTHHSTTSNGNEGDNNNQDQTNDMVQPKGSSLRVEIKYDEHPTENAWMLFNDDTQEELYWSNYGDVSVPGLDTSVTFPDLEDGRYVFVLLDNFNDGICCEHGNGYVKVYEVFAPETDGGEKLLWSQNGHFENTAGVAFVVDDDTAGSSTSQSDHGNISIDPRRIDLGSASLLSKLPSFSSSSRTRQNHNPDLP